jgi:hypothetical protein
MTGFQTNSDDTPKWVLEGKRAMDALQQDQREIIVGYLFGLILFDVKNGLAGENHESFFEEIDKLYEKACENEHKCFFCNSEEIDTGVCLGCLMKILEIKGVDLDGSTKQNH